jgi:hypothetical protein
VDAVVTFVVRILELEEPVADDATPGQRRRLWHTAIDGVPVFITLGNDQNAGEAGLTWAGMVKARPAAPSLVWRFLTKVLKFL